MLGYELALDGLKAPIVEAPERLIDRLDLFGCEVGEPMYGRLPDDASSLGFREDKVLVRDQEPGLNRLNEKPIHVVNRSNRGRLRATAFASPRPLRARSPGKLSSELSDEREDGELDSHGQVHFAIEELCELDKGVLVADEPAGLHHVLLLVLGCLDAAAYQTDPLQVLVQEVLEGKVEHLGIGLEALYVLQQVVGKLNKGDVEEPVELFVLKEDADTELLVM